jgi:DNA polymerase (family 10)
MDAFQRFSEVAEVIARGDTKMAVRTESKFQIDLRVVPKESFGAALQYFTGSKEHNVVVRSRAKQLGLRINEWGVFQTDGREAHRIAGETETDIYAAIKLPVIPPELRENRREFDLADRGALPQLIQLADIQGDLHMHTSASDGVATIAEMAEAAKSRGLKFIAITDHSKRVAMANGLNEERLLEQWRQIDLYNQQASDEFLILKGVECDILENGELDIRDDVLTQADWVIASVHYGQSQPKSQITDRIIGALRHPSVSMIAHPTGRILNRRPPYDVDLDAVIQAAAEHRKFLELNASPKRLDLNDHNLMAAQERGVPIVINTDAHRPHDLAQMRCGILQARRGYLQASDVANCWNWKEMRDYLKKNRNHSRPPLDAR